MFPFHKLTAIAVIVLLSAPDFLQADTVTDWNETAIPAADLDRVPYREVIVPNRNPAKPPTQ